MLEKLKPATVTVEVNTQIHKFLDYNDYHSDAADEDKLHRKFLVNHLTMVREVSKFMAS